jgi:predicted ester cyclase
MAPEDHKTKVHRVWDEVWNKGNVNALDEIADPDIVCHQPPGPDINGLAAYKQHMAGLRRAFSSFEFTFHEHIIEGDTDAVRYTMRGVHTGQLPDMPIPPTGKQVTMTGLSMVRMENGKAVEQWNYSDVVGFMQQLGVAPPMGKPGG